MAELHRTLLIAALLDVVIWLCIGAFIFQAGRWYERSLSKSRSKDDNWEPKEPTL